MIKINYHYSIPFKPVEVFKWKRYNNIVSLETYKDKIMPKITDIINNLQKNPNSRQEVIIVNEEIKDNSCLLSLQFQIVDNTLIQIANYRSQCALSGRPVDTLMNRYIATQIKNLLRLKGVKIYVNVGNFHTNPDYLQDSDVL